MSTNEKAIRSNKLELMCQIGLTRGFTLKVFYTWNDLVLKVKISSRIYNLGLASIAKSAFESHFPNSIIPGKPKFIVSNPFLHSKFDKFI